MATPEPPAQALGKPLEPAAFKKLIKDPKIAPSPPTHTLPFPYTLRPFLSLFPLSLSWCPAQE